MNPTEVHAFAARLMHEVWEPFKADKLAEFYHQDVIGHHRLQTLSYRDLENRLAWDRKNRANQAFNITDIIAEEDKFAIRFIFTAQEKTQKQSAENIEIPPIPKQTAGAVAGAAVGSVAGPIGAVVGGVAGAVAGKAAEKRRPIAPAARRTVRSVVKRSKTISKVRGAEPPARTSVGKSRKARRTKTKSRKAAASRRSSSSHRAARKRHGGRSKRH